MKPSSIDQQQIVNWFDQTYKRRKTNYLRPVDAYRIYLHLLEAKAGASLLDIACGPGQLLMVGKEQGLELHGIDISSEAIRQCQARLPEAKVQVANAEHLPFADQRFDYLTCLGSLERMIDLEQVLREQVRVAKDDARFCYLVRNADAPSWKLVKQTLGIQNHTGHQTAKSLVEWTTLFTQVGLQIEAIYPDQWPLVRWRRWLSGQSSSIDYTKIRKGWLPLNKAYEFIFLLKKNTPTK
ncbi:MAG: class I SAM-dependent methyltransferase [Bacteroidota bacterium]